MFPAIFSKESEGKHMTVKTYKEVKNGQIVDMVSITGMKKAEYDIIKMCLGYIINNAGMTDTIESAASLILSELENIQK